MLRLCITLTACLLFTSFARAQEAEKQHKWDDAFFGFDIEKPERGRFWLVSGTMPFTDGDRFEEGDEIIKFNGKTVTVDDDLLTMLRSAEGEVKLTAKRMVNKRRKIDTATFSRATVWDIVLKPHIKKHDPFNEWDVVRIESAFSSLSGKTYLLPEFIFKESHPNTAFLRFQYRSDDWLFVEKLTIRHGDFRTEVKKDFFRDAKREIVSGGIREWFVITGDEAMKILNAIGSSPNQTTYVRLHGKDYYRDIELSSLERGAFCFGHNLWKYGKQRQAAMAK